MEYEERKILRVFSIKFNPGDKIIGSLENFVREKDIRTGVVLYQGAFSEGNLVLGFRKYSKGSLDFDRVSFHKTLEVIGLGSISWVKNKPKIHLHVGGAREREVFIAHIDEANVKGLELFVIELSGGDFASVALV